MGMRDKFKISSDLAAKGVWLDYGDFRVKIGRAGEGNPKFKARAEAIQKQHKRAIDLDLLSDEIGRRLAFELYADAVIFEWQIWTGEGDPDDREDDPKNWRDGIEGPDGDVIPASRENIVATFKELPDLFLDIKSNAEQIQLFRAALISDQVKN